ncbi:MAG: hypothetical protein CMJ52_08095 [Planctomycetaceae bacterium]|nr:hypothetical protein [Planctomycetaceae bacterium]
MLIEITNFLFQFINLCTVLACCVVLGYSLLKEILLQIKILFQLNFLFLQGFFLTLQFGHVSLKRLNFTEKLFNFIFLALKDFSLSLFHSR